MNIQKFIEHFSHYTGSFEYILSKKDTSIFKCLFQFHTPAPDIILDFLSQQGTVSSSVIQVFESYGDYISHIGIDTLTHRYKFYISLYHIPLKDGLQILTNCKKIFGVMPSYKLEKTFQKFDCIGFDISHDSSITLKVYELCHFQEEYLLMLPHAIFPEMVQDMGFLKDDTGRKKIFFRFKKPINIDMFEDTFCLAQLEKFTKDIKNFSDVQKQVKYYCIEEENKEIYFI